MCGRSTRDGTQGTVHAKKKYIDKRYQTNRQTSQLLDQPGPEGQVGENQDQSLTVRTGIETFKSWFLISRQESRLLKLESWYWDWNQEYQILSLDIKTGIKTFKIIVSISRLVSRLKIGRDPCDQDSRRDTAHLWFRARTNNKSFILLPYFHYIHHAHTV